MAHRQDPHAEFGAPAHPRNLAQAFAAICELVGGEERLAENSTWGNGMIANTAWAATSRGFRPAPKWAAGTSDGDFFLHFLDSAEQGLLVVILWSDIHPQGGGTFIACDSVPHIARWLAAHPEGVEPNGFETKRLILESTTFARPPAAPATSSCYTPSRCTPPATSPAARRVS